MTFLISTMAVHCPAALNVNRQPAWPWRHAAHACAPRMRMEAHGKFWHTSACTMTIYIHMHKQAQPEARLVGDAHRLARSTFAARLEHSGWSTFNPSRCSSKPGILDHTRMPHAAWVLTYAATLAPHRMPGLFACTRSLSGHCLHARGLPTRPCPTLMLQLPLLGPCRSQGAAAAHYSALATISQPSIVASRAGSGALSFPDLCFAQSAGQYKHAACGWQARAAGSNS
jgi:hypothetical protein